MNLAGCRRLCALAREEFADNVLDARDIETNEPRILLVDGSSIDVWYSLKLVGRYSYHWERRAIDGTIYRHGNAPHARWRGVSTFPKPYHDGDEYVVVESRLSESQEDPCASSWASPEKDCSAAEPSQESS